MEIRPVLHILLHFLVPFLIASIFYKRKKWRAGVIMSAAIIVDLDHLLASPVYDPCRCSIGFHPLHSAAAIGMYALMSFVPENKNIRLAGIGLAIHMLLDWTDCLWMRYF